MVAESKREGSYVGCREIIVCDDVKCIYSDDAGGYEGVIRWLNGQDIRLFLTCDPEKPGDTVVMKFFFENFYREREAWTKLAVRFACDRFVPYMRKTGGFAMKHALRKEFVEKMLVPGDLELDVDGTVHMSFKCFALGNKMHFLDVAGTTGTGFTVLQDNGDDIEAE